AQPKTHMGYACHLRDKHTSSLLKNGIYLMCSCGTRISCVNSSKKHGNELCNGRDFTLHKLDDN
ncbi:hypothetical protein PMAYCL1PPCAC_01200, partial [Pristionchus mayeri]